MVKGVAKRVIVVKSPDTRIFEQAIFILKDDAMKASVTEHDILNEAERIAAQYVRRAKPARVRFRNPLLCSAAGGLLVGIVWIISTLMR